MLCYHCKKAEDCATFRNLYSMSTDFAINKCRNYVETEADKYKLIAENDELMKLIYDYFTHQVVGNYTDEEVKQAITSALWSL
ncbi:MAG: hypothetical protein PUC73_12630 [Lachnospiraceae bacterium]|nr:hypothetical protein [Lachnospiraceae bacterium]